MKTLALALNSKSNRIDLQSKTASFLTWLENAVTVSLYTDARVSKDELPDGETDQRGYWGDMELPEGQSLGSKLWTLRRAKLTQNTLNKTHDFCVEALQWLVDAEHLQAIDVTVQRGGNSRVEFLINCQLLDGSWIELYREYNYGV